MKIILISISGMLSATFVQAQNVGIGTQAPDRARLEVHGAVGATSAIFGGESTGISIQRNWPTIGFNEYYGSGQKYLGAGFAALQALDPTNGNMYFTMFPSGLPDGDITTQQTAMVISNAGKVGIGGAIPNGTLQLPNTLYNRKIVLWESANNDHQFFGLGIQSGTLRYTVANPGDAHRFYTGLSPTTSRLLAEINGLAGTSSLRVFRGIGIDGTAVFEGSTYDSHFNYGGVEDTYIRGGISGSRVILNDIPNGYVSIGNGSGRLGVNTLEPQANVDIRQSVTYAAISLGHSSYNPNWEIWAPMSLQFRFNGQLKAYISENDGSWNSVSDKRLKTNIQRVDSVLEKIKLIRAVRYSMLGDDEPTTRIGCVAQEVREAFPELITAQAGKEAGYAHLDSILMVNYGALGVIAIKAIQEQQEVILRQQAEIDELRADLLHIRGVVDALTIPNPGRKRTRRPPDISHSPADVVNAGGDRN